MRGARPGPRALGAILAAGLLVAGWSLAPADATAPVPWVPVATALLGRTLLTWPVDADPSSLVTTVGVERSEGGAPFVRVADLPGTATSWVDTEVTPGVGSDYRLTVSTGAGVVQIPQVTAGAVGTSEELLVAAGAGAADLMSAPLANGTPLGLGTHQDADAPAVSPDGRFVAYVVRDAALATSVWVRSLDPAGPPPRLLVDDPAADELDPAWSPDGTRICYTHQASSSAVEVRCIGTEDGAVAAALPGGRDASEPTFLPDGSGIVVVSHDIGELARVDADGYRYEIPGSQGATRPAVSPRGGVVAFTVTPAEGTAEVRTLPTDGGRVTTRLRSADAGTAYGRAVWSPDGSSLAVPTWAAGADDAVTVWRADAQGGAGTTSTVSPTGGLPVTALAWRRLDTSAPTIEFPKAATRTTGTTSVPVRVLDDTVPVGGLTVSCTLDGVSVARCDGGYRGTSASGSHTVVVTATDPFGHTASAAHAWTVDGDGPVVSVAALPVAVLGTSVTVGYAASDPSGIAGFDVRVRYAAWSSSAFSRFSQPATWTGTTARSVTVNVSIGYEYCFSVRATDGLGTPSAWSSERCTARPLDDRSLVAGRGWVQASSSSAYAGTLTRTTTAGASLTRPGSVVRRVVVVATTCPTCGALDVYAGSSRIGAVGLYSSTTRTRQVFSVVATSLRSGTITLRARTTGRLVTVDALGVRKT